MKKNLRNSIIVLVALTILVLPLFGGGQREQEAAQAQEDDVLEITFWHHEAPAHRMAAFQRVADLFEAENPGIKVTQEIILWGDAWTKSLSALEAGTLPDFQFSIPDLTLTMYQAGALAPMTDLVEELDAEYTFFPNQSQIYAHEGEYWGLPVFAMVMVMTYRPSFLEEYLGVSEPPDTWEEVLSAARQISEESDGEVYGMGIGAGRNLMTSEQAYIFLAGAGAMIFDEDGDIIFDSPETIRALEMYNDLIQYAPPGAEAWSWGEIELNLAAGTLAMAPYFPSVQKRFHEDFDSDDYAAAHIPYFSGRDTRGTITYPNDVHIYKHTLEDPERYQAVMDFIRFMMRPDINAELTAKQEPGGFFPTTEAASEAPEYWNDPVVQRFEDMHVTSMEALNDYANLYGFEYGRWVNLGIGDMTGADILAQVVNNVVSGEMTPAEAAAWGAGEMERFSVPVR
jgi:multiple sugar transport system substrate-binding protein